MSSNKNKDTAAITVCVEKVMCVLVLVPAKKDGDETGTQSRLDLPLLSTPDNMSVCDSMTPRPSSPTDLPHIDDDDNNNNNNHNYNANVSPISQHNSNLNNTDTNNTPQTETGAASKQTTANGTVWIDQEQVQQVWHWTLDWHCCIYCTCMSI